MDFSYDIHSMLHTATVDMQPTKLELIDGFKEAEGGYQYIPENTTAKVVISGRDWGDKRLLIYGSTSEEEAMEYINQVIDKIRAVGHSIDLEKGPDISNLAINGQFERELDLRTLNRDLYEEGYLVEYEPEQFPGLKLPIENPECTFLLFSTGAFVIQGLRKKSNVKPALVEVSDLIPN